MVGKLCSSDVIHSVGGRPSKRVYKPGRPLVSINHQTHPSNSSPEKVVAGFSNCPVCLERPIELKSCDRIVCADCLCTWLQVSQTTSCPSEITLKALETLEVTCSDCAKRGYLKHHKASMCGTSHFKPAPLDLSDLLNQPEHCHQLRRYNYLP